MVVSVVEVIGLWGTEWILDEQGRSSKLVHHPSSQDSTHRVGRGSVCSVKAGMFTFLFFFKKKSWDGVNTCPFFLGGGIYRSSLVTSPLGFV